MCKETGNEKGKGGTREGEGLPFGLLCGTSGAGSNTSPTLFLWNLIARCLDDLLFREQSVQALTVQTLKQFG